MLGKFSTAKAPWKSIVKGLDWFGTNISWKINNGESISFWLNKQSTNGPLATAFSRLYALSQAKTIQ